MERREMLLSGFRRLVRTLPDWLAAAGSLGILLNKPGGTPAGPEASCFPAGQEGQPDKAPTPFFEEEE